MPVLVGDLLVKLALENAQYKDELEKTRQQTEKDTTSMADGAALLGKAWNVVAPIAVAGLTAIAGATAYAVGEAMAAQEAQAQLNAVIASTGGVAGVSAEEATDYASSLQDVTRYSDETVVSAESMLLTFTNVGEEVFPQATEMALDMATALGQDASQAAMQLGKALNDPVEGVTALQRVGVKLTESQAEQVRGFMEVNDIASAQAVILAELQTEFGGSARAAGETFAGQLDIAKNSLSDVAETWGGALLPIVQNFAEQALPVLMDGLNVMTTAHLPAFVELVGKSAEVLLGAFEAGMLLITWSDRVNIAFADQSANLITTTSSYAEYQAGMQAAAAAIGEQIVFTDELTEAQAETMDVRIGLTEEQYLAVSAAERLNDEGGKLADGFERQAESSEIALTATEALRDEQEKLKQTMSDLQLFIDGPLGAEYEDFQEKNDELAAKVVDLKTRIGELESKTYLTAAQKEELATLRGELGETETAIGDLATAHEEATRRIMFDLLTQRAAMDGFTSAEVGFLTDVALNWGLVDQATADYVVAADEYLATLESDTSEYLGGVRYEHALYLGILDETFEHPGWIGVPEKMHKWLMTAEENMGPTATEIELLHDPLSTAAGLAGDVATNLNNIQDVDVTITVTTVHKTGGGGGGGGGVDDPIATLRIDDPATLFESYMDVAGGARGPGGVFAGMLADEIGQFTGQLAALDEEIAAMGSIDWFEQKKYLALTTKRRDMVDEIAEREAEITEFNEKQQELAFLQAQMDLLNMAKSSGMDVSKLGGMLGKDADVTDLMSIMDSIFSNMLDQADTALGSISGDGEPGPGRTLNPGGTTILGGPPSYSVASPSQPVIQINGDVYVTADDPAQFLEQLYAVR